MADFLTRSKSVVVDRPCDSNVAKDLTQALEGPYQQWCKAGLPNSGRVRTYTTQAAVADLLVCTTDSL